MPLRTPPIGTPYRPQGQAILPELGSDWLSNLSRFAQAERGDPASRGMEITPPVPGAQMPNAMEGEDIRALIVQLLAQGRL
jgi:hypothetical protein